MRATYHSSRCGKSGVYNPNHNDRNFSGASETEEINTWRWTYTNEISFEDSERLFYYEHFREGLEARNKRYIEHGNADKVKTTDEYRQNRQSCPDETIYQLGKLGETIPREDLGELVLQQKDWEEQTFPQVKFLNIAVHVENGAPHCHIRKAFVAVDKYGYEFSGMNEALKQMGIEPEGMDGRGNRYKNRKVGYTRMCREHWEELCREYCREHHIKWESERLPASETGKSQLRYICDELKKQIAKLDEELKLKSDVKEAKDKVCALAEKLQQELNEIEDNKAKMPRAYELTLKIIEKGYDKELKELCLKALQRPKTKTDNNYRGR